MRSGQRKSSRRGRRRDLAGSAPHRLDRPERRSCDEIADEGRDEQGERQCDQELDVNSASRASSRSSSDSPTTSTRPHRRRPGRDGTGRATRRSVPDVIVLDDDPRASRARRSSSSASSCERAADPKATAIDPPGRRAPARSPPRLQRIADRRPASRPPAATAASSASLRRCSRSFTRSSSVEPRRR